MFYLKVLCFREAIVAMTSRSRKKAVLRKGFVVFPDEPELFTAMVVKKGSVKKSMRNDYSWI